jgi:hypothetical protein
MTVGLKDTNLANKWLDMLGGTAFTAPASCNGQLHTADPGVAGTTSPCNGASSAGTRKAITWAAAAAGAKAMSGTPSWTSWDGGSVTISHLSFWDAIGAGNPATGGNFLFSGVLSSGKAITNGDTFNLTSLSVSLAPLAA